MKCSNCQAELQEGAPFCAFCGTKVEAPAVKAETDNNSENKTEDIKYHFQSVAWTAMGLSVCGWVYADVYLKENGISIEATPQKKCGDATFIKYDDIVSITKKSKIPFGKILRMIYVLTIPTTLLFGWNTIITIKSKYGQKMIIYSNDKASALELKNKLQQLVQNR